MEYSQKIDRIIPVSGFEAQYKLGKIEQITEILNRQDEDMVQEIFNEPFLGKIRPFNGLSTDAAENKRLQIELMKVHINDQYLSANLTNKLLLKYSRDKTEVIIDSVFIYTDAINSERLKVTFKVHGFPTGKLECI